ncbi:MAG TPA: hypothetical protein VH916_00115 [Dehalococcoidia bacterium]|jgi:hypothetical protein
MPRKPPPPGFYAEALDPEDRADLEAARSVRGLEQEIAVLRLRLRRLLAEQPNDFALTVRAMELLVRAVNAAGRGAAEDEHAVLEQLSAGLGGILELLAEANEGQ